MTTLEQRIVDALKKANKPMNRNELAKRTGAYKRNKKEFHSVLDEMVFSQQVVENKGRYGLTRRLNLIPAEIVKVSGTFGFARPIEGGKADLFVPGRSLMGAMPGDKVLLKVSKSSSGELSEGEVIKITEEENQPFVGILVQSEKGDYSIVPDKYVQFPMFLDKKISEGAKVGDKVLVQITKRGNRHSTHRVEMLKAFGSSEKASICAEAILAENNIPREFPAEVQEQARAIGSGTGIHPKELAVRTDLRDWNIFTIDGADTKDIDDAISLTATANGWELGVHIADVSYYVTRQSPLDNEAFARGTSVYYADQVIPMLPKELSNGICSLNPQEDRLAFSAMVQIDKAGKMLGYRFEKTAIRSRIKGVYSEINQILDRDNPTTKEWTEKYADQLGTLEDMRTLAELLHANRMKRNAMDLESKESKIIIGEGGLAVDIIPRITGISESMIEEFMLTANEAAASLAMEKALPFVYRVHEEPASDRLENFFALMDNLGIAYNRPKPDQSVAQSLDEILAKVKGTPLAHIVNFSMLRTMAKAKYSAENLGHFGLALKNYAHFTSPIRRYPDLAIHRILSAFLTNMRPENVEKHFRNWVDHCSDHCSKREIASMTAERGAEDCYKAEYMLSFVGKQMEGIVSSATSFGIFVQLDNTVEGLIHMDNFPAGRWYFDRMITYKNEIGGATIRVGDKITIDVTAVNVAAGNIDFAFAHPEEYTPAEEKKK